MTKRIVHGLKLTKIAAVDFPCQEHALAAIHKARGGKPVSCADITVWNGEVRKNTTAGSVIRGAFCDAITKGGMSLTDGDADEGAQLFDAVLGTEKLTQKFWDDFYKGTNALQQSLLSIIKDDDVADKAAMIDNSLKEFAAYIGEILPGDVGKALAAGIAASIAGGARTTDQGVTMSDALKKALGLQPSATEAEMLKALEDRDTLAKGLIAPMTAAHVSYFAKVADPAAADAFQKMSAADRDKKMKDEPKEDPETDMAKAIAAGTAFTSVDGAVIFKAKVGVETYAILKSMDDGRRADRAIIKAGEEATISKAYEEQAVDLGFAKSFAPTLRKAFNGDATAQAELAKEIKALRTQVDTGELFKEKGGASPKAGSAAAELEAKAAEYKKAHPDLSSEQAFSRVYKSRDNAALVQRYKAEAAGNA